MCILSLHSPGSLPLLKRNVILRQVLEGIILTISASHRRRIPLVRRWNEVLLLVSLMRSILSGELCLRIELLLLTQVWLSWSYGHILLREVARRLGEASRSELEMLHAVDELVDL